MEEPDIVSKSFHYNWPKNYNIKNRYMVKENLYNQLQSSDQNKLKTKRNNNKINKSKIDSKINLIPLLIWINGKDTSLLQKI